MKVDEAKLKAPKGEVNVSKVRKVDLKDFITAMVKERRKEVVEERKDFAEMVLEPHLLQYAKRHRFDQIAEAGRIIDKLMDDLTAETAKSNYSFRGFYRDIETYAIKVASYVRGHYQHELTVWYANPFGDSRAHKFEPLGDSARKAVEAGLEKAIEMKRRYDALGKLETELHNIITQAKSGKDAYNKLIALEVDMSSFTAYEPALPAVVSLSESVCILNKTC